LGSPSLLSNGYGGALSPVVKGPGREADHSPPISAEVKNTWILSSIRLHDVVLKYRDHFTYDNNNNNNNNNNNKTKLRGL
jgi:hypothetical protein